MHRYDYTVHMQCMATESASVWNNMLTGLILLCALMLVYWSRFNWESSFGREQHVRRYSHHHDDDTFSIQRQCHRALGSSCRLNQSESLRQPFNLRTFLRQLAGFSNHSTKLVNLLSFNPQISKKTSEWATFTPCPVSSQSVWYGNSVSKWGYMSALLLLASFRHFQKHRVLIEKQDWSCWKNTEGINYPAFL